MVTYWLGLFSYADQHLQPGYNLLVVPLIPEVMIAQFSISPYRIIPNNFTFDINQRRGTLALR